MNVKNFGKNLSKNLVFKIKILQNVKSLANEKDFFVGNENTVIAERNLKIFFYKNSKNFSIGHCKPEDLM